MLDMRAMSSSSWVQKGISRGRMWSSAIEQGVSGAVEVTIPITEMSYLVFSELIHLPVQIYQYP